jgi:hypothetical protein
VVIILRDGFEQRFPQVEALKNFERDNKKLRKASWKLVEDKREYGDDDRIKVLVVGNSHAKDVFNTFEQNTNLFPQFDFLNYSTNANFQLVCFNKNFSEFSEVADEFFKSGAYRRSDIVVVSTSFSASRPCDKKIDRQKTGSDLDGLGFLLGQIQDDNKKAIVFGNSPTFEKKQGKWILDLEFKKIDRLAKNGADLNNVGKNFSDRVRSEYFKSKVDDDILNNKIEKLARKLGVPYIDKAQFVCDDTNKICFGVTDEGYKAFYDSAHYTLEGAKFFGQRMHRLGIGELMQDLVKDGQFQASQ